MSPAPAEVIAPAPTEVETLVNSWALTAHPEGGFFRETLRGDEVNGRPSYTSIIYTLRKGERSCLHRLDAAELWLHQGGGALRITELLEPSGETRHTILGPNAKAGQVLQYVVQANTWFGCEVEDGDFGVAACVVVPGFVWNSFEMGSRATLLKQFGGAKDVVTRLTADPAEEPR